MADTEEAGIGRRTQAAISASHEAIGLERRLGGIEGALGSLGGKLDDLADQKAMAFAKQEQRAKRIDGLIAIGKQLTATAALKYYTGIVVLVVGSYLGISVSGYGLSLSAADCTGTPVAAPAQAAEPG